MKKIILCEGCSWTAGSFIDPKLDTTGVMSSENNEYRLQRVWPHSLGKLLDVDVLNSGIAGSSNDAIVRRTIENVFSLLEQYKSDEICVIIGWTSPERKDFYLKMDSKEYDAWVTLYPAQLYNFKENRDVEKFFELYGMYFWNSEEYLNRFIHQNLYLHSFLENKNIKHLFYSSFYEAEQNQGIKFNVSSKLYLDGTGKEEFPGPEYRNTEKTITNFLENSDFFMDISFLKYLETKRLEDPDRVQSSKYSFHDSMFFKDHHPTPYGHQLWAEYLSKRLDNDFNK
jgi:hypothetical protein